MEARSFYVPNMRKLRRYEVRGTSDKGQTDVRGIHEGEQGNLFAHSAKYRRRTGFREVSRTTTYLLRLGQSGIHVDFRTTTHTLRLGQSGNQVKYEPNFICFVSVDTTFFATSF